MLRKLPAAALAALAAALVTGCATGPDSDPRDPFEPMNRAVYRFNDVVDEAVAKPVATAYRDVVPEPARGWVRNFFGNIGDIFIGANNLLQGKVGDGLLDWFRVVVNTVMGPLGINDWASEMGIEKHNEDFGQTFGWWGFGPGPYLVLPVLGSSSVRDGAGTVLDMYTDPIGDIDRVRVRNSLVVTRLVGVRADLLDASRLLEQAALDRYTFQRDAYLQRRRSLVHDGSPPRERFDDEERPGRDEGDGKEGAGEKKGAAPVNSPAASNVYHDARNNVYSPRVPANYEAVLAAGGVK